MRSKHRSPIKFEQVVQETTAILLLGFKVSEYDLFSQSRKVYSSIFPFGKCCLLIKIRLFSKRS